MDITRDIIFRDFKLNDAGVLVTAGNGIGSGIAGCIVDSADMSDVDVVQFLEKRSLQDGMDAGDVYLGTRRVRIAGTLYNVTRALLFDDFWALRQVMSPVLAQREEPADKGYRPLYFSVPTNRTAEYPEGIIDLMVYALPRAFQGIFQRDGQGGEDSNALAIPWQATWICKDPTVYSAEPVDYELVGTGTHTGDTTNRGTYIAPLNMLLVVGTAAGSIAVSVGDSNFTITVPASTGSRIIRYKGVDKILTIEEDNIELPRMGNLVFTGQNTHPLIPSGVAAYTVTFTGVTPAAGSHMWHYETYA